MGGRAIPGGAALASNGRPRSLGATAALIGSGANTVAAGAALRSTALRRPAPASASFAFAAGVGVAPANYSLYLDLPTGQTMGLNAATGQADLQGGDAALVLAQAAAKLPAGGVITMAPAWYPVHSSQTLPATISLRFPAGGGFVVDAGKTLALPGPVETPGAVLATGAGAVTTGASASGPKVWGSSAITQDLTVGGTATIAALAISGLSSLTGNLSVGGTLGVSGTSTLAALVATTGTFSALLSAQAGVAVTGALSVSGLATLNAGLTVSAGGATISGAFTAQNNVAVSGTLGVGGTSTLAALVATTGTFSALLSAQAGAAVTGALSVSGTLNANGGIVMGSGSLSVPGSLTVTGSATVGALTAAGATLSAPLAVTATNVLDLTLTDTGAGGARLKLSGNGATKPSKTLQAQNGAFFVLGDTGSPLFFHDESQFQVPTGSLRINSSSSQPHLTVENNAPSGEMRAFVTQGAAGSTSDRVMRLRNLGGGGLANATDAMVAVRRHDDSMDMLWVSRDGFLSLAALSGATPTKTLQVIPGGTFQILNDAKTTALLALTEAGLLAAASLSVVGGATVGTTLGVTGAATFGSTLGVTGATTLAGLTATSAQINGALVATGAATLGVSGQNSVVTGYSGGQWLFGASGPGSNDGGFLYYTPPASGNVGNAVTLASGATGGALQTFAVRTQLVDLSQQSSMLGFGTANVAPPGTSGGSLPAYAAFPGMRLRLYDGASSAASYGFGIAVSQLWANVAAGGNFAWYANGVQIMNLNSGGALTLYRNDGAAMYQFRFDNSNADPGMPWFRSDGNFLVANPHGTGQMYLCWDNPQQCNFGGAIAASGAVSSTTSLAAGTTVTATGALIGHGSYQAVETADGNPLHIEIHRPAGSVLVAGNTSTTVTFTFTRAYGALPACFGSCMSGGADDGNVVAGRVVSLSTTSVTMGFKNIDPNQQTMNNFAIIAVG